MANIENLSAKINERFSTLLHQSIIANNELTIVVASQHLPEICFALRDEEGFEFNQLMDVCGVDFLHYGLSEWETYSATETGFERGVEVNVFKTEKSDKPRFATVYHLLSTIQNHRVRIKVFLDSLHPAVPSVIDIWPFANLWQFYFFNETRIFLIRHSVYSPTS